MHEDLDARVEAGHIDQRDAEILKQYLFSLQAVRGVHPNTIETAYRSLLPWIGLLSLSSMTLQDLHRARAALDTRGLKRNTVRTYLSHMRRYCLWAIDQGYLAIEVAEIKRIRMPAPDHMTKQASEMLTEDEVKRMIEACARVRDRACLSMLYEGGFRPGDLVELIWGQVKFDDYGIVINTSKKTGKPRYVRLILSKDYLTTWRQEWPGDASGQNRVFVTLRRPAQPLTHRGFKEIVKRAARLSGLEKPVSLYLFRHSRITNMIKQGIPESVIKLQHWGSLSTTMLATYGHLSNEDQDNALLEHYGIKRPEKKQEAAMMPVQCENCHHINPPTMRYCGLCGHGLTEDVRLSAEEQLRRTQQQPEYNDLAKEVERLAEEVERLKKRDQIP